MSKIIFNSFDYERITRCKKVARQFDYISNKEAEYILGELKSVEILVPKGIPSTDVTKESIERMSSINSKKQVFFHLVYPDKANTREIEISFIFSVTIALIGNKLRDDTEWIFTDGIKKE